ncbi:MAG: SPOR domain-containing protein [Clostridium sp.]|nr:SPOR domain-containing protein [Clostridium sp.]
MKYTNYQYKKKKSGVKLLSSLLMTTLCAISLGLVTAWILLKIMPNIANLQEVNKVPDVIENSGENTSEEVSVEGFTAIQCGYFSKEENANAILEKISDDLNSFIVKDEENVYRVIVGVSNEEDITEITDELNSIGVENVKVKMKVNGNDKIENQISAITTGYLEVLKTAGNNEVKEVATNDFKAWTKELEAITEGENLEVLNEYKQHVLNLPEVINKTNITEGLKYIYTTLNKIQS